MAKDVTLTIDNKQVTVPAGTVIVDAAKMAGNDIPVFCYHPKMAPVGMCRMCLVEVGRPEIDRATGQPVLDEDGSPKVRFGPNLETGCTVPVMEGMVVRSAISERAKKGRQDIVEFILTSHPLDCPICDKGGECPLQNLTMAHGPGKSRFIFDDKIRFSKHVPLGDLIFLDRERCIQCARCTRFQSEVADDPVIGFYNRGRRLEIQTHSDPGFASYFSGNTTDICPVGALTTADFRFGARPWELNQAASICAQCSVGCNITMNTRREAKTGGGWVIKRVMPRQNESVNEIWICDKGRFSAYQFMESEARLTEPLVRKNGELVPTTWGEALDLAAEKLKAAGKDLAVIVSGRLANEDLFNLSQFAKHQGGAQILDTYMGGGDLVAQAGVGEGTNLGDLGTGDAIVVAACDLEEEAPIWWLRVKQAAERGAALIVVNPRATKTDRHASVSVRYPYGGAVKAVADLASGQGEAGKLLAEAENFVVFFGAEGSGLAESQALAQACANLLIGSGKVGKPNNGLIGVWPQANVQGAWELGYRPVANLSESLQGAKALYIAGANPVGDNPAAADAVNAADFVVVQELFLTETAKLADVVLPVQAYPEREGSFTSGERRVQRFYMAVPPSAGVRADFTIAAQLAMRLGLELEGRLAARVMRQLAEAVPAFQEISYVGLAQVTEQWPIIGRGDMYYGGTTYDNSQGLGTHLAASALELKKVEPVAVKQAAVDGLLAVPVTRLYDRGEIVDKSTVLQPRLMEPFVVLHPEDAKALNVLDGGVVDVVMNTQTIQAAVKLDATISKGVVLVPRSMGFSISGPTAVAVQAKTAAIA